MCNELLVWLIVFCSVSKDVNSLLRPSYVSPWHTMDIANSTTLSHTFTHGLGEVPVFCDVQVRSRNTGFIYPGIGSGFMDDDRGLKGGVVFYYNQDQVTVMGACPPGSSGSNAVPYIILTGDSAYLPTHREQRTTADVRVRLWRQSDFPPPSQTIPTFSVTRNQVYHKAHQLMTVPMMTIVQLRMTNGPTGWVSQAQGSHSYISGNEDGGGTMFGVNSASVVVETMSNYVFTYSDGWGPSTTRSWSHRSTSADVTIKLWSCLESDIIFSHSVSHSIQAASEPASHDVSITVPYSHDDDLIIVRAETTGGTYAGYYFDGLGAALVDFSTPSTYYLLGGLVYATSNDTIRMWHPVENSDCTNCRCIVKVNDYCQQSARVHMTIVEGMNTSYPDNTQLPLHGHVSDRKACRTEFLCNDTYIYQQGSTEMFLVNGTWTNTDDPLKCVRCDTVESGTNAILYLHPEMYANATYECEPGYSLVSGDLNRTCLELGLNTFGWSGTKPICHAEVTTTTTVPTTTTTTATTATTTTTIVAATTTSAASTSSVPTTTPPPTIPPPVCFNITATSSPEVIEEAVKIAEEISKNLTVDVKTTAAFQRSITSATDERASAFYVGMIGYLVFGIVFGLLFLLDMLSVVKYIMERDDDDDEPYVR